MSRRSDDDSSPYIVTIQATAKVDIQDAESERDAIQQAERQVTVRDYRIDRSRDRPR